MARKHSGAGSGIDRRIRLARKALSPDAIADSFGLGEKAGQVTSEFGAGGARTRAAVAYYCRAARLLYLYAVRWLGRALRR
ncbi:MAG: hypothetical protein V1691_02045 [Chloroflexota bacterium]